MRTRFFKISFSTALFAAGALLASEHAASAKSARCYTSDEGHYNCRFTGTDNQGSFQISAPGKPTYILNIEKPGVAYGFADFGSGRNVALPGFYIRQRSDPACWANADTNTAICAW